MMQMKHMVAAAVAAGVATLGLGSLPASASTSPVFGGTQGSTAAYGFDGNANLVVGGGSDTTYLILQKLTDLYNLGQDSGSALCSTNKTPNAFTPGSAYPPPAAGDNKTAAISQCDPAAQTFNASDYDADVIVDGPVAGSSAGIASLNGYSGGQSGTYPYEGVNANVTTADGTDNGFGTPDFARSSRAPKLTKGNCALSGPAPNSYTNDELACDTFWGYAQDGVEVTVFDEKNTPNAPINLTPAQLDGIWNCSITQWSQINSSLTGPIVPWAMNTQSGTYGTFNSYVAGAASDPSFAVDNNVPYGTAAPLAGNGAIATSKGCVRELANPTLSGNQLNPLENDIKGFTNDANAYGDSRPAPYGGAPAGLSSDPNSTQNPQNWIWFSSFGVLSTFPYTSAETLGSFAVTSGPASINNVAPSQSTIVLNRYPIGRTLFHVTKKSDADCPVNPNQAPSTTSALNPKSCDFTNNPTASPTPYCNAVSNPNGGAELDVITKADTYTNVNGCQTPTQTGTTGASGAVREFTRWLCRGSGDQTGIDPFNGSSWSADISTALNTVGFTVVPTTLRSPGSSCAVYSQG